MKQFVQAKRAQVATGCLDATNVEINVNLRCRKMIANYFVSRSRRGHILLVSKRKVNLKKMYI